MNIAKMLLIRPVQVIFLLYIVFMPRGQNLYCIHISTRNYFNHFIICYTAKMSRGIRRNFVSHYKYSLFTNFIIWFRIF